MITKTIQAKRNQAFAAASKAEKRVMIAQDALNMSKSGALKASQFTYIKFPVSWREKGESQVCDLISKKESCKVCAYGGMMLSEIRFNNDVKVKDGGPFGELNQEKKGDRLRKFFSEDQLFLIENCFEGWGCYDLERGEKIDAFYDKYPKNKDRFEQIMKNLIRNKGTFIL